MKIAEWTRADRPREKMLRHGAETLGNAELLAVVLRSGTQECNAVDLARRLLSSAGGTLTRLAQTVPQDLCREKGVGIGKALSVLAAFELGRRMLQEGSPEGGSLIVSPDDIYDWMLPRLKGLPREECRAVWLNRGGRVIGEERISSGNDGSTSLEAADVARRAVAARAHGVILVHNHPSGDPTPSRHDIRMTTEIRAALQLFHIRLLDHVIVSDGAFFSFSREVITTR